MSEFQAFPQIQTRFVDPATGVLEIPWMNFLLALWNRTGGAVGTGGVPTGSVIWFAGATLPSDFVLCDGAQFARNSSLFAVIGVAFGIGDGSTTANLPNLVNRLPIGAGGTYARGATGGAVGVTISVANLPAHSHPIIDPGHVHGVTDPGHAHNYDKSTGSDTDTPPAGTGMTTPVATATSVAMTGISVNSATTGITTSNTGGGVAISTLPPYLGLYPMIKT